MPGSFQFLPAEWVEELPSTNTELLARARGDAGLPGGTVLAARIQTAGRGRQRRAWMAEPGRNLTFSFLWRGAVSESWVPSLSQALSLGIAVYLDGEGIRALIKWPNDVLVAGQKIAGILCERLEGAGGEVIVVAGIGLNVNMTAEQAGRIDQPATSLLLETGETRAVESVLEGLLPCLAGALAPWERGGFAGIAMDYAARSVSIGSAIRVRDGDRHVEGRLAGFNESGGLLLETESGPRAFYSGDVSL